MDLARSPGRSGSWRFWSGFRLPGSGGLQVARKTSAGCSHVPKGKGRSTGEPVAATGWNRIVHQPIGPSHGPHHPDLNASATLPAFGLSSVASWQAIPRRSDSRGIPDDAVIIRPMRCAGCNSRLVEPGFRHCAGCLQELSDRAARWKAHLHPDRCSECASRAAELGRSRCRHCLDLLQARMARRRADLRRAGGCTECGAELAPGDREAGRSSCSRCREQARSRWQAWQRRQSWHDHQGSRFRVSG